MSPHALYWSVLFRERGRAVAADLCIRRGHRVEATDGGLVGNRLSDDTPLSFGPVRSWTEALVLPTGKRAGDARCEAARTGYVQADPDGRTAEGYRALQALVAAAGGRSPLPFALSCSAEDAADCTKARTALASLSGVAPGWIDTSCLPSQEIRTPYGDGSVVGVRCPTLESGQPYRVMVRFGPEGTGGRSWTISFEHRRGWPEQVALRRTTVI